MPAISPNADADIEQTLQQQVCEAHQQQQPLCIIGGDSKSFYGREASGEEIHTSAHCGVIDYDPAELVITVRAGTRLIEVQNLLASKNQMLGFEPPHFSATATIGGAVACGLAGPRRPYVGTVRDFVLGVKMLNGRGEILNFGGRVMKNVAGFDLSRLMVGTMGTLGLLLEVSLKILPQPKQEKTIRLSQAKQNDAVALFNQLAARPIPLSAAAWSNGETRIRLSGNEAVVEDVAKTIAKSIGGEVDSSAKDFWQQLREHELPFFHSANRLLRVSVPPGINLQGAQLGIYPNNAPPIIDWGGAQRWILCDADNDTDTLQKAVATQGGHVTVFRYGDRKHNIFQPLTETQRVLHTRLKRAFDPAGILNPERLYQDF